jgi:hypothetical protein
MNIGAIDTMNICYNLKNSGISRANVIDALYTKQESYVYEVGSNNIHHTNWRGDFISQNENRIHAFLGDNSLTIYGSIPKFINGNNFEGITKSKIESAFDNLSEVIGSDLYCGKVTRVDYAGNIFMDNSPKLYYKFFGDSYKFKRLEFSSNIAWQGTRGQARYKTIEDKTVWANDTRNEIPYLYQDKNIIRYENRLKSSNRIAHVMGMGGNTPTLSDVLKPENIIEIHKDWKRQYLKIKKQNNLIDFTKYMQKDYYSPQEAYDCLVMSLIQEAGEEQIQEFMKFIREGKKFGTGQTGSNNTYKFRKKIDRLRANWIRKNNDMIMEIDKAVESTVFMD